MKTWWPCNARLYVVKAFATIGQDQAQQVSRASVIVRLAKWEDRSKSQIEIMQQLRQRIVGL
jgi:hypothetical protein